MNHIYIYVYIYIYIHTNMFPRCVCVFIFIFLLFDGCEVMRVAAHLPMCMEVGWMGVGMGM